MGNEQGWAPASFLEPINTSVELDEPEPLYHGKYDISTLVMYTARVLTGTAAQFYKALPSFISEIVLRKHFWRTCFQKLNARILSQ